MNGCNVICFLFLIVGHSLADPNKAVRVPQVSDCHLIRARTDQGSFFSHDGYPGINYEPGYQCRVVINAPLGKGVEASITTNHIKIRKFDYVMFIDGSVADKLDFICDPEKYKELGKSGTRGQYIAVLQKFMSKKKVSRGLQSNTSSTIVMDFCVDSYDNATLDSQMKGFQVMYNAVELKHVLLTADLGSNRPIPTAFNQSACGWPATSPSKKHHRIVNGVTARENSWPWICALVVPEKRTQLCGCTLISNQWIVTAAHCVDNKMFFPSGYNVYIGVQNLRWATPENIYNTTDEVIHPDYLNRTSGMMVSDIAMLKLSRPVKAFSDDVMPACLSNIGINNYDAEVFGEIAGNGRRICYVAGWGLLYTHQPQEGIIGSLRSKSESPLEGNLRSKSLRGGTDFLQQVAIEIFDLEECKNMYSKTLYFIEFTEKIFCGGYDDGVYDACQGDSGGPVVCEDTKGRWTLHGVVSTGNPQCGNAKAPGIYTSVSMFIDWIQDIVKNRK